MFEFIMQGGIAMIPLTVLGAVVLAIAMYAGLSEKPDLDIEEHISRINGLGLLACIIGVLAQLVGLYGALEAIGNAGGISPSLLAAGLMNSMASTIYGLGIFAMARLSSFLLLRFRA